MKTGTTAAPTNASITAASYTYDSQYQLTKEVLNIQSQNGLTQTSNYNFDTFGNLRSKSYSRSDGLSGTITFTYGNTAWQDQLTKVHRLLHPEPAGRCYRHRRHKWYESGYL